MQALRALLVIVGLLALAGIASAATPTPTTIEKIPGHVAALAQDGGLLAWLSGDGTHCNTIHLTGDGNTYVLPQPPSGSMTCHWDLSHGTEQLAVAAGASAALWTLHQRGSDFVLTAQVGGDEIRVDRLAHQSNGAGWWLGGTTGEGTTLAYSAIDVDYIDPLACASGGSCKKKIADGGISLVSDGQTSPLPNSDPAIDLAANNGRIAYVPATAVVKGTPASSPSAAVRVVDVPSGTVISVANPVGVPLAVGLAPHVLAVLSRAARIRLTWYDPTTGQKLGGIAVPDTTAPEIGVDDQVIAYRYGRVQRTLVLATRHVRALGQTAPAFLGLSLDEGRLVWAENGSSSGRIRALSLH